eukprot:TRINITY_DN11462_c0_g1_i1.p1 TRINITY_DN11462_c0_g1~~TRINITY_DN11462_c0_g1_i1.p1  ORF type:complete len:1151 (-),score=146.02 TRINITY_DN11462_c0_g1_i1:283-3735(-)
MSANTCNTPRKSLVLPPKDVLLSLPQSAIAGFACECAANGFVSGLRALSEIGISVNVSTPYDRRTPLHLAAAAGHLETVKFLVEECGATLQRDRFGLVPTHDAVEKGHAEIRRYLQTKPLPEDTKALSGSFSRRFGSDADLTQKYSGFKHAPSVQDLMGTVFELAVKEGVFSYSTVRAEVRCFFHELDLHPIYFDHFTPYQIAKHVHCLIAAKRVARTTDDMGRMDFVLKSEDAGFFLSTINSPVPTEAQQRTEEKVGAFLADSVNRGQTAASLMFMASDGAVFPGRDDRLGIWSAKRERFQARPDQIAVGETSLELLATTSFLKEKTWAAREQYLLTMEDVVATQRAVVRIVPGDMYPGPCPSGFVVIFGMLDTGGRQYFAEVCQAMRFVGISPKRFYMEPFLNGALIYSMFFPSATQAQVEKLQRTIMYSSLLDISPGGSEMIYQNVMAAKITHEVGLYLSAGVKFVYAFFPKEQYATEYTAVHSVLEKDQASQHKLESLYKLCMKELLSQERIYDIVQRHLLRGGLAAELFADFRRIATGESQPRYNQDLDRLIEQNCVDPQDRQILRMFLTFNASLSLTNFFKKEGTVAIAYRLDPRVVLKGRPTSLYPEIPYAIYLVVGKDFTGFHTRFRDVSRGGIRIIASRSKEAYERNFATLFDEGYNLAFTQQNKNKDIPESGSKGVILPNYALLGSQTDTSSMKACFSRYFDALLDCMLPEQSGIFSGHLGGRQEILFFGPDENTAGFMDHGCELGRARNYPFWKALTTGKSTKLGGVPHDTYGMTTTSVHTFVTELLKELGEDEQKITKFQTGGPDGDLGSNEILMSMDRTIGVVDGSGVLYDPSGIHRGELSRLARARLPVKHFSRAHLGAGAFLVTIDETNVELPDGSKWRTGTSLRDTFHLTSFASADLFVPCGGRPSSVSMENIKLLFHSDGRPKFRMVVEGANLFFTEEARIVLEDAGVHVFKDASTNKGGVTSSSLEVFAALAIQGDEHTNLMTYDPNAGGELPDFYERYVEEILNIIRSNAKLEFRAIWNACKNKAMRKVEATKQLSAHINATTDNMALQLNQMTEEDRKSLMHNVLKIAVPPSLLDRVGIEGIMKNVPQNYVFSIVACWIASRYVYQYGSNASEVSFFFFMRSLFEGKSTQ